MRIIRQAPYLSDSLSPMARTACHYQRERDTMTTKQHEAAASEAFRVASANSEALNATYWRLSVIHEAAKVIAQAARDASDPAAYAYAAAADACGTARYDAADAHATAHVAFSYAFLAYCHASPSLYAIATEGRTYADAYATVARHEARRTAS